jgi:glycine/D-amino acid oxidase-like deaminating enzyme/nitrite reductase/ring-hydroxylating ferredoxin subunit
VGGGITGVSTALLLQESGKKCLLLEAANLCFGTTGGTTAHLNTLLDVPYSDISKNFGKEAAKIVADATKDGIQLIRNHIKQYNIDCGFSDANGYLYAQDDKQEDELEKILKASKEAGITIDYCDDIPVPCPFTKAVRAFGQAKFHPIPYVYALAQAFEKAGGIIQQDCRVIGVEENGVLDVETTVDTYKTRNVVYATHIPPGVNLLHLRCVPWRSYAMAVTMAGNNYPVDLTYDMEDPYNYYRTQQVDGRSYFIAGGNDHKTAHEENTNNRFLQLESHLRKFFDIKEINYQWSSQFFESADGLPYIGHLRGHPNNIFVATGYGGNGMVFSSVAALVLQEMLAAGKDRYENIFNPNRVKPIAGFSTFISHNADVVKQFAGKWFSHEQLEELSNLAAGEGKVVEFENQRLAIYKTPEGVIHALNPICTHLKCEVKWNNTELTWDCPCHGTRYNYDGRVITGPADQDLEKIEIRELIEK